MRTNGLPTTKLRCKSWANFAQTLKRISRAYCKNTGLHGFQYIVRGETTFERIIWLMVCTSSVFFCVTLMLRLWQYYSDNPIVTTIDTTNPVSELHFPGVTICNNNKVFKPHADNIAKELLMKGFDNSMSNKLFSSLMKLIRPDRMKIDNGTATRALDILGYTVEKLMFELMQPCNLLLARCSWLGQLYDCSKIFKTVKSNEGFCCGFNYHFDLFNDYNKEYPWLIKVTNNSLDLNSSEPLPGVETILQVPGTGHDIGLAVALNVDVKNYKSSVRQFVGATVLIHDPLDYPDIGAQSATLQPGHVMSVTLGGTKIKSSENIRSIPLRKRMCLFDDETPGERKYSYRTCISECTHRKLYGSCGCLPFFYPKDHPSDRTCYLTDMDCILTRMRSLSREELRDCKCLPQCNDKSYEMVSESVALSNVEFESELTRGLDVKQMSFLYIYFRDGTFLEYRKRTILGWDNLLAAFGGIFGLCLGGSVISLVEFLYYLVKDFISVRKVKREQRNLPAASKLFISVPANMDLDKYSKSNLYGRTLLEWDHPQPGRKCPDLKLNMYYE
ncbi:pickpocket protein 28-like [Ceratina calcarata]|uniref:Pickpocket protein 28-like n=1 Tax=Ceratina calcarata TaxID=156304 RepID=A0AAJ7WG67_9HYME|nr:pickpocket protein 28-like [Ceratina calcarata]